MNYPILTIEQTSVISYEKRDLSFNFIEYTLGYEDIHTFEGHTLEFLAMKFYGKRIWWYRIYDINPTIFPDDYEEGMVVRIPLINEANLHPKLITFDRGMVRQ